MIGIVIIDTRGKQIEEHGESSKASERQTNCFSFLPSSFSLQWVWQREIIVFIIVIVVVVVVAAATSTGAASIRSTQVISKATFWSLKSGLSWYSCRHSTLLRPIPTGLVQRSYCYNYHYSSIGCWREKHNVIWASGNQLSCHPSSIQPDQQAEANNNNPSLVVRVIIYLALLASLSLSVSLSLSLSLFLTPLRLLEGSTTSLKNRYKHWTTFVHSSTSQTDSFRLSIRRSWRRRRRRRRSISCSLTSLSWVNKFRASGS